MVTIPQLIKIKASIINNPYLIPEINLNLKQEENFLGNYRRYCSSHEIDSKKSSVGLSEFSTYIHVGMIAPKRDYRKKYMITDFEDHLYQAFRTLYRAENKSCPESNICGITGGHEGHDREWLVEVYIANPILSEKYLIVGWSSWCDIESVWSMSVIWIHPFLRRGFVKRNWERWQALYGDFRVQAPFSVPMKKALEQVGYFTCSGK